MNVFCLIEKFNSKHNYESISQILCEGNTVVFVQSEIKENIGRSFESIEDGMLKTNIKVYRDQIMNKSNLVYSDTKSSRENSFFFTTTKRGSYYIVLKAETNEISLMETLGIDLKIFMGEANRPSIVSGNDVEVYKAENMIKKIVEYVDNNIVLQSMEEDDELRYQSMYNSLIRRVFYFLVIRLASVVLTIFAANYSTRRFYSSQGILSPK